jgi:cytochrome c-type biogenesis protein CcmH/NrfF
MMVVDDAVLFGRQMADKAHRLCQEKGMSSAESTSHFLDQIGKRVRDMDATGESGGAIAAWVEAVVAAYGRRIDELTG